MLFDVGENYLVMELLEGETLADRLSRGPLPVAEAAQIGIQIADALDRAHRAGILHRDLKPGNVMLTPAGVKLLDFGLAKIRTATAEPSAVTLQKSLTAEGTVVGTLQYMAPEQLEGRETDARGDVFALGAILYEMVSGRRAFEGDSRASVIARILGSEPPPLAGMQRMTPPAFERIVRRCLVKHPSLPAMCVASWSCWKSRKRPPARPPFARAVWWRSSFSWPSWRRRRACGWPLVEALPPLPSAACSSLSRRRRIR
ncbi:MAG: serine/threonine-protein kinase [Acidobacteriota bacterium]